MDSQKAASFSIAKKCIPGVAKTILVASGKGGVGKSTVASFLAQAFTRMHLRVGLLDADIYGPSIPTLTNTEDSLPEFTKRGYLMPVKTRHFGHVMSIQHLINQSQGLGQVKPFAWRGLMLTKALQQLLWSIEWPNVDFLIVDMPPGTGDPYLTISQQVVVHGSLLVTTPSAVAKGPVLRSATLMNMLGVNILGIVENMSWWTCPVCHNTLEEPVEAEDKTNIPIIARIPLDLGLLKGSFQKEQVQILFDQLAKSLIEKFDNHATANH